MASLASWISTLSLPSRFKLPTILAVCGMYGFLVGAFVTPQWQSCVEHSQVLAGLVRYPQNNPFYLCQIKLWSLITQISAFLLYVGISEVTLCRLVSGFTTMLSFQVLGLCAWLMGKDVLAALATVALILHLRAYEVIVSYPINLLPTFFTFGALGLSYMALVILLFAAGCIRSGAFLLGLSPSIHFSLAVCVVPAVWLIALWRERRLAEILSMSKWFCAGALVCFGSFLYQYSCWADLPSVPLHEQQDYLGAYYRFWDAHRQPPVIGQVLPAVFATTSCMLLALTQLIGRHPGRLGGTPFLWRAIVVLGSCGLAGVAVAYDQKILPDFVNVLMPSRWINLVTLLFAPIFLGAVFGLKERLAAQVLLLAFVACSLVGFVLLFGARKLLFLYPYEPLFSRAWALLLVAGPTLLIFISSRLKSRWRCNATSHSLLRNTRLATVCILLGLVAWDISQVFSERRRFPDIPVDQIRSALGPSGGFLLTASNLCVIQLLTRQPVLMNGGEMDLLVYAQEAFPEADRILQTAYGVDLRNPPQIYHHGARGELALLEAKELFESRTDVAWQGIATTFGISHVVTYVDWRLQLPLVWEAGHLRVYRIPHHP